MKVGYFTSHPFAKAGFLAFPLIILILVMERFYPTLAPEGYNSFIIAFEFARTPEQIQTLLQGLTPAQLNKIDISNYIDFVFMFTYTLFLILFSQTTYKILNQKLLLIVIPFILLIMFADVYENFLMFKITNIYSTKAGIIEINSILKMLFIATWVKWGGLSLIFAVSAVKLLKEELLTRVEAIFCCIPIVLSFFAFSNNPSIISWFTLSIFLVFFLLIAFSFTYNTEK